MQSVFGRLFGTDRGKRNRGASPRRLEARAECLESRNLMTGGSVTQVGSLVSVAPAPTGPNTTVVSYQVHGGTTMLDLNLNGQDNFFSTSQVSLVYYWGSGSSGAQIFQDSTNLNVIAFGGSGTNLFEAGSGEDEFFGGSGSNTFDAGTGFDLLVGGPGANTFNENATGSGEILELSAQNTVNVPPETAGFYMVF
jgi:Ca2+-binding RTX toxin-like protein